jgi:hypothetical protein
MRHTIRILTLPALIACLYTPANAADYATNASQYVHDHVRGWAETPGVLAAITAQNTANAALTQDGIDALDKAWRAEITSQAQPTISPILINPTSDLLRAKIDESKGMIVEAFIMDNRGLNVASASLTSDYWQGDEEKFTETFGKGPDSLQIGEVEFDESSQMYSIQVSFTINDPATATPIGAMTIALNAEALE